MKKQLDDVKVFHETFEIENGTTPVLLFENEFLLRCNLMKEETKEYEDACWNGDLVEVADALGDQLYILCGTILKHGMQDIIEEVFTEIQRSNMSKLGEDNKPIFREDGKILKGVNYSKPNIHNILHKHLKDGTDKNG
jgi:predicted HAD superfamily Cof-like phosphohydrolase